MNIIFGGDFFVSDDFSGRDLIDDTVAALFARADYRVLNLEAPLTGEIHENRIEKTGPHLRSLDSTTIPILKKLKVDLVTLANNHILDYGGRGLADTLKALEENNIDSVGAGGS